MLVVCGPTGALRPPKPGATQRQGLAAPQHPAPPAASPAPVHWRPRYGIENSRRHADVRGRERKGVPPSPSLCAREPGRGLPPGQGAPPPPSPAFIAFLFSRTKPVWASASRHLARARCHAPGQEGHGRGGRVPREAPSRPRPRPPRPPTPGSRLNTTPLNALRTPITTQSRERRAKDEQSASSTHRRGSTSVACYLSAAAVRWVGGRVGQP